MSNLIGGLLSGLGQPQNLQQGLMWQQQGLGQYALTVNSTAFTFCDDARDAMVLRIGETAPVVEGGYRHPEQAWLDKRVNEMRVSL